MPIQVYENQNIALWQPDDPLAGGSLELSYKGDSNAVHESALNALQHLRELHPTFTLERRTKEASLRQVIPYPNGTFLSILRQIQVIWNLIMPKFLHFASSQLAVDKEKLQSALAKPFETKPASDHKNDKTDFVCNMPEQVKKQLVYEGKKVWLLYNFKPLSKVDLLIVPKAHAKDITELDQETYLEAVRLANQIAEHYLQEYPIVYINQANGKAAGQAMNHWNLHVTVASSVWEELLGAIKVIGKILGLVRALSDEQLAKVTSKTKADLKM